MPDFDDYLHAAILLAEKKANGEDVDDAIERLAQMADEGTGGEDEGGEEPPAG